MVILMKAVVIVLLSVVSVYRSIVLSETVRTVVLTTTMMNVIVR